MTNWPTAKLGEVLAPIARAERVDPAREYRMLGARWYAQGLFVKDHVLGQSINAPKVYRVESGDFVYNRLFAWKGSFALAGDEFGGCYVSNEFPCFAIAKERLEPAFLRWWFSRESVWLRALGLSTGATPTSRNRLKEADLLSLEIPLPPLPEQRRVVARIEEVAGLVRKAHVLREQVDLGDIALEVSLAHRRDLSDQEKIDKGWEFVPLAEVIEQVEDRVAVGADASYPNFGILSFGKGLFQKPAILGLESSAQFLNRVHSGQFIYSRLFAFEGAYGQVTSEYDGWFVSNEYPTFRCDPERALAGFLVAYFKPWATWRAVAEGSKGLGDRRQRVQPSQILKHSLWLPPMEVQRRAERVGAERYAAERLRADSTAALDALLPAVLDRAFRGEL